MQDIKEGVQDRFQDMKDFGCKVGDKLCEAKNKLVDKIEGGFNKVQHASYNP
jgi:hypothetical protein